MEIMDNLPIKKEELNKIPIQYQKYIIAKNDTKISSLSIEDAITFIYDEIKKVELLYVGYKKTSDNETKTLDIILSEALYKLIITKYSNLTKKELGLCFFLGVTKEYGEFYGLSLNTFASWLIYYVNDENKKKAILLVNNILDSETKVDISEKEKDKIVYESLVKLFEEQKPIYLEFKDKFKLELPVISFTFFDLLKKYGYIKINDSLRERINKTASHKYEQYLRNQKKKGILKNLIFP